MDTGCTTDACRGETITQAIANQSAIVKAVAAAAGTRPFFVAYMWMELLELKEAGTLTLPPDVACVWTDFPGESGGVWYNGGRGGCMPCCACTP